MATSSFDSSNLMYVNKAYENEIKEKAKRIFTDDSVNSTLEAINKELDDVLADFNKKLGFVTNTLNDKVETFIKDTHSGIDAIDVDSKSLVDDGIEATASHPSINATKDSRVNSVYKTYDFINKNIPLNIDTIGLRFSDGELQSNDKVHKFTFNITEEEYIKVVEFAFTYKQKPDIVKLSNDGKIYREPTVGITRVITGRFFIIRHDPINNPEQIIVKAIIQNSDNTGSVIDEQIIDVAATREHPDSLTTKSEYGPQFDLYFKMESSTKLNICLGKIVPYKWFIQKTYIDTGNTYIPNFKILENNVTIKACKYSKNLDTFFIIKDDGYYITKDRNISSNTYIPLSTELLSYTGDLSVIDAGDYVFVSNGVDSFVAINNLDAAKVYKDKNIVKAELVSSGEIMVQVGDEYISFYINDDISTNHFIDFEKTDSEILTQHSTFIELEPGKIIIFTPDTNTISYKLKRSNLTTGKYFGSTDNSPYDKISLDNLYGYYANDVSVQAIKSSVGNVFLLINHKRNGEKTISHVVSFDNLKITSSVAKFEKINTIKEYNFSTKSSDVLDSVITRLIETSLFTFGITDDNKLMIVDDYLITKAVKFDPVEIDGEIRYTDKNSFLYMLPGEYESEYFVVDNPYFNIIRDVYETSTGIFVLADNGIYEIQANKNIKTCFYSDSGDLFTTNGCVVKTKDTDTNYAIIFGNTEVIKQSYNINISDDKLRHKYNNIYDNDVIIYNPELSYNYELVKDKVLLDFKGTLFVSFVDHNSPVYNTDNSKNITCTESVYSELNPYEDHYASFMVNNENLSKKVVITKFNLSTNKYGFVNYYGFTLYDQLTKNVSDINECKKYILVHTKNDGLSIADFRASILAAIKNQIEIHDRIVEIKKTYISDANEDLAKNKILEIPYFKNYKSATSFVYPPVNVNSKVYGIINRSGGEPTIYQLDNFNNVITVTSNMNTDASKLYSLIQTKTNNVIDDTNKIVSSVPKANFTLLSTNDIVTYNKHESEKDCYYVLMNDGNIYYYNMTTPSMKIIGNVSDNVDSISSTCFIKTISNGAIVVTNTSTYIIRNNTIERLFEFKLVNSYKGIIEILNNIYVYDSDYFLFGKLDISNKKIIDYKLPNYYSLAFKIKYVSYNFYGIYLVGSDVLNSANSAGSHVVFYMPFEEPQFNICEQIDDLKNLDTDKPFDGTKVLYSGELNNGDSKIGKKNDHIDLVVDDPESINLYKNGRLVKNILDSIPKPYKLSYYSQLDEHEQSLYPNSTRLIYERSSLVKISSLEEIEKLYYNHDKVYTMLEPHGRDDLAHGYFDKFHMLQRIEYDISSTDQSKNYVKTKFNYPLKGVKYYTRTTGNTFIEVSTNNGYLDKFDNNVVYYEHVHKFVEIFEGSLSNIDFNNNIYITVNPVYDSSLNDDYYLLYENYNNEVDGLLYDNNTEINDTYITYIRDNIVKLDDEKLYIKLLFTKDINNDGIIWKDNFSTDIDIILDLSNFEIICKDDEKYHLPITFIDRSNNIGVLSSQYFDISTTYAQKINNNGGDALNHFYIRNKTDSRLNYKVLVKTNADKTEIYDIIGYVKYAKNTSSGLFVTTINNESFKYNYETNSLEPINQFGVVGYIETVLEKDENVYFMIYNNDTISIYKYIDDTNTFALVHMINSDEKLLVPLVNIGDTDNLVFYTYKDPAPAAVQYTREETYKLIRYTKTVDDLEFTRTELSDGLLFDFDHGDGSEIGYKIINDKLYLYSLIVPGDGEKNVDIIRIDKDLETMSRYFTNLQINSESISIYNIFDNDLLYNDYILLDRSTPSVKGDLELLDFSKKIYTNNDNILINKATSGFHKMIGMKCLPYKLSNDRLLFSNGKVNYNTLDVDELDTISIFDKNGIVKFDNEIVAFEQFLETEYGVFGLYNGWLCLNKTVTDDEGWIALTNTNNKSSKFKQFIDTEHGVFYACDNKVFKYNPDTDVFDEVETEMATIGKKINFIKDFGNYGLYIGYLYDNDVDSYPTDYLTLNFTSSTLNVSYETTNVGVINVYKSNKFVNYWDDEIRDTVKNNNKVKTTFVGKTVLSDIKLTNIGLILVFNILSNKSDNTVGVTSVMVLNEDSNKIYYRMITNSTDQTEVILGDYQFLSVYEDNNKNIYLHRLYHPYTQDIITVSTPNYDAK